MQVIKLQFYDYALQPISTAAVNVSPHGSTINWDIAPTASRHAIGYHNTTLIYAMWNIQENELLVIGEETVSTSDITNVTTFTINSLTQTNGTILTKFKNYPQ